MTQPLLYDSHMHTTLCNHAQGEPDDYAQVALNLGLKGIIFTCHNPGPPGWSRRIRMTLSQFPQYINMIQEAQVKWAGQLDIRLGLECDYTPGMEPFLSELLQQAPFDYVLGSVHPYLPYYRDAYYRGHVHQFYQVYFRHLAQAAQTGLFQCLAHPDIVKNSFPDEWDFYQLRDDIARMLDTVALNGIALELNTSGLTKRIHEMCPSDLMLGEMCKREIPVVLGSDAHEPGRVGADFDSALETLAYAGYTRLSYYLEQQRLEINLNQARHSLLRADPVRWL
jgi:histidinol-phosphatase (PHP family)